MASRFKNFRDAVAHKLLRRGYADAARDEVLAGKRSTRDYRPTAPRQPRAHALSGGTTRPTHMVKADSRRRNKAARAARRLNRSQR